MLQKGNTYKLYATIEDIDNVQKVVFAFNDIRKVYNSDGTGDIEKQDDKLVIKLSQEETLQLDDKVEYQIAVKYKEDDVIRSSINKTKALRTIIEEAI